MIDLKTLSADWLGEKRKKYPKDPTIMESMVHALYLLEQLKLTGLDFIFKGGTSLVLLMAQPKRFSVDIDIIVNPLISREQLEESLSKIIETSSFISMKLDEKRSYKTGVPKAHYKFNYISNFPTKNKNGEIISTPKREILLDILFVENHYPMLVENSIKTEWLIQKDEPLSVITPDINSILGDKLTAFAPNTTGILYGDGKEKEIIKQLFDVGCLFDLLSDIEIFKKSFLESVQKEIEFRHERKIKGAEEVLMDIVYTGILIAKNDNLKDSDDKIKFREIKLGISQFNNFVFAEKFSILNTQVCCAKAAYLATIILSDFKGDLAIFNPFIPLHNYTIINTEFNFLNKQLKHIAKGEALFYWFQAVNLLPIKSPV